MEPSRWPIVAGVVVLVALAAVGGWAIGRAGSSGGESTQPGSEPAAVRSVNGVAVGVLRTRAGALAAADNYVAASSQTVVANPAAFRRLVRSVWTPQAQTQALADAADVRRAAPDAITNYADGGRGVSLVAARRLESFSGSTAKVLSWGGGFVWGPHKKPTQRWFLARTHLVWRHDRWRVQRLDELSKPAPVPYAIAVAGKKADATSTFEAALRGMSAPFYGTGG